MANYGRIHLATPTTPDELGSQLQDAVDSWFGARRFLANDADFEDGGPTWLVALRDEKKYTREEVIALEASSWGPMEFAVALNDKGHTIAFRHSPMNPFARWAQGVTEEILADTYDTGVTYDATDETRPPGSGLYRIKRPGYRAAFQDHDSISGRYPTWVCRLCGQQFAVSPPSTVPEHRDGSGWCGAAGAALYNPYADHPEDSGTFWDYVTRNFEKPLSAESELYLSRYDGVVPAEFWKPRA